MNFLFDDDLIVQENIQNMAVLRKMTDRLLASRCLHSCVDQGIEQPSEDCHHFF